MLGDLIEKNNVSYWGIEGDCLDAENKETSPESNSHQTHKFYTPSNNLRLVDWL